MFSGPLNYLDNKSRRSSKWGFQNGEPGRPSIWFLLPFDSTNAKKLTLLVSHSFHNFLGLVLSLKMLSHLHVMLQSWKISGYLYSCDLPPRPLLGSAPVLSLGLISKMLWTGGIDQCMGLLVGDPDWGNLFNKFDPTLPPSDDYFLIFTWFSL